MWEKVLKLDYFTPMSYLDEVYTKYTDDGVTHVLANVYVNSRPDSSWQDLHGGLYRHGEMAAAKDAKTFLQQQNGEVGIRY